MADGNSELLAAFDYLAKSVNQVQIGNSIKRAQSKIDDIRKDQNTNDFEKIRAQQALAQAMGTEVIAKGGDAAQAQQARLSLAPDVPDAAMRELEATGKGTLAEAQKQVTEQAQKRAIELKRAEDDAQLRRIQLLNQGKLDVANTKVEGNTVKRLTDFGKALDPSGQRQGMFSKPLGMVQAADRVQGLIKQFPDYSVPKAQTHELAAAVAAMVSGGSVQSQQQINDIVPSSARGNAEDIASWVTNEPTGRAQQGFVKMMADTAAREKEVAKKQIYDIQDQRLLEYSDLLQHANPMVKSRAEAIRDKFTGAYRPADMQQGSSAQSSQGYPGGQGAGNSPIGKYIKINP